ncbi:hypothetical protein [Halobellus sp. GM3]|uniref:hypothetical protein n=1 Tax=Halobellus sp. GM3 TaxID=3458410 RepID=UPI00403DD36D
MALPNIVRQTYRGYGVAAVVWAGWSIAWAGTGLRMDPATIGYGWLAIAAVGAVLAGTMVTMRVHDDYQLFRTDRRHRKRFEAHSLGSTPLHLYVAGMGAWGVLTAAWVLGSVGSLSATIVAYGWFGIALYGAVLTVGLAVKHKQELRDAAVDVTPSAVGLDF